MDALHQANGFGNEDASSLQASTTTRYTPSTLSYVLLILILTLLTTRLLSGQHTRPRILANNALTVPTVPYWLPFLGHLPSLSWDASTFTTHLRTAYPKGAFALTLGGTTHNIIHHPSLVSALLTHRSPAASSDDIGKRILVRVFGLPRRDLPAYTAALPDLQACYKHILTSPGLDTLVAQTASKIKENALFLVSFAPSLVDQPPWERAADTSLTTNAAGTAVVEASPLPLIRDWCAHTANPAIIGSNFLPNNPTFLSDLWTLDRGILALIAGLPRWVPIPRITRAHIAKQNILRALDAFHRAMDAEANGQDPGPDWRDLDDVGDLVKARMAVYRRHGFSIRARAAAEHSLLWAANANANVLVFWLLNRIYASPALLADIRAEIAPHVRVVQPASDLPIPELPRFEALDVEALCTRCPLLKSCYVECLRLDAASWSPREVREDFVLQARGEGKETAAWQLRKGEYAHAAHDLYNTDPAYFSDPMTWKADRHIRYESTGEGDTKRAVVDSGSLRPYGGGSSMCKGRAFALKEVLAFTASVVAVWEMEAAGGGEWKVPRHRKATGVFGTGDDVRVWIKKRELPGKSG